MAVMMAMQIMVRTVMIAGDFDNDISKGQVVKVNDLRLDCFAHRWQDIPSASRTFV